MNQYNENTFNYFSLYEIFPKDTMNRGDITSRRIMSFEKSSKYYGHSFTYQLECQVPKKEFREIILYGSIKNSALLGLKESKKLIALTLLLPSVFHFLNDLFVVAHLRIFPL